MKFPKTIKIAGFDYTIETFKGKLIIPSEELANNQNGEEMIAMGACSDTQLIIQISQAYPEQQQLATLIHEINHAIAERYNIPLSDKYEEMEAQIEGFALGMFQVLKDNPKFLEMFLPEKKTKATEASL